MFITSIKAEEKTGIPAPLLQGKSVGQGRLVPQVDPS